MNMSTNKNESRFSFTFYGHLAEYCRKSNVNLEEMLSYGTDLNMVLYCEEPMTEDIADELVQVLGRTKEYWMAVHNAYYSGKLLYLYPYRDDNDGCGWFRLVNMQNEIDNAKLNDISVSDMMKQSWVKTVIFLKLFGLAFMKIFQFIFIPLCLSVLFYTVGYTSWKQISIGFIVTLVFAPVFWFLYFYIGYLFDSAVIKIKNRSGVRK